MKTRIAWHILFYNKRRAFAVVASVGFAILLMFLQLGLYDACEKNASLVYELLDFDAVLISPSYLFIDRTGTIPIQRLYQAKGIPGVENAIPLHVGYATFRNASSGVKRDIFVMGANCSQRPWRNRAIDSQFGLLSENETALMDELSIDEYGPRNPGVLVEVANRRIRIVGNYAHGAGFISDGTVIVSYRMFVSLFKKAPFNRVNCGLIQLSEGADLSSALTAIRSGLPDDVWVWSRERLEKNDRFFVMKVKPVGIMFTSGVVIAFLVGAVIVYQILCVEVSNNLAEYATLKAMGYRPWRLKSILLEEGFLLILMGYLPAFSAALYLYGIIKEELHLPIEMTALRTVAVLALSLSLCAISGFLAIGKVETADPAELF